MTQTPQNLPHAGNILRTSFDNGSTLLAWHNSTSPAVVIQGLLPPGTVADTPGQYGLANLTTAMLMTGTQKHDFQALHEKIESLGASIHVQSGKLMTSFALQCLAEDLPTILDLLTEILSQPAFPEKHFARIQSQILTTLAIRAQDTAAMADQAFDRLLYQTHPFAHPSIGYAQDMMALTLDDLRAFHSDYYTPQNMIIAASGGLAPEELTKIVENTLGAWHKTAPQKQPDLPDFFPPTKSQREHITMEDKSQTDLIIGVLGPKTQGDDFQAASIANNILGQFGMMGRVGESVREKAGLAYYVQSALGAGLGPTPWQVVAGVNPSNLDKAIALIKEELHKFICMPVTTEELEDSRAQAIGRLPLALESNTGITRSLLSMERYQLGLNHLRDLPAKLAAITAQDILTVAQRYWNLDTLIISSAGKEIA